MVILPKRFSFFASITAILLAVFLFGQARAQAAELELTYPTASQEVDSPKPRLEGTAPVGNQVIVIIDGVQNGIAPVSNGYFVYTPFLPLSSGSHLVNLKSHDTLTDTTVDAGKTWIISIKHHPAPVLLVPGTGVVVGSDRVWIGGVVKNNSTVRVLADGEEKTRTQAKNHRSGSGSFGVRLTNVSLGDHLITAIARDSRGKDSISSAPLAITVGPPTPAPIVFRPMRGGSRPVIAGLAKNGLEVNIVVDGQVVKTFIPDLDTSGTANFMWQLEKSLGAGTHRIQAFTSDNGKISVTSAPVFWTIGLPKSAATSQASPPLPDTATPITVNTESAVSTPLSVSGGTKPEQPIIPTDGAGRIESDAGADNADNKVARTDVTEVAPGAVVRNTSQAEPSGWRLNSSLVIGITILFFLLLSMLVWYIQEKREKIGDKVVSIFRESEQLPSTAVLPRDLMVNQKKAGNAGKVDLPPPPPVF